MNTLINKVYWNVWAKLGTVDPREEDGAEAVEQQHDRQQPALLHARQPRGPPPRARRRVARVHARRRCCWFTHDFKPAAAANLP